MILFQNKGEIDPRLITTLGVNVKDGKSPIGFFGTGLKYAIAVLLREGCEVSIVSGMSQMNFTVIPETIRGKEFGFIRMKTEIGDEPSVVQVLGFTTELGKNWSLANAYRELHCNCTDEGGVGGTSTKEFGIKREEGQVTIMVVGETFEEVYAKRYEFLLDPSRTLVAGDTHVDVYAGESDYMYYRGIAAYKLPRRSANLYNFKVDMLLTEDRTLASTYHADQILTKFFAGEAEMPEYVFAALAVPEAYEQEHLSFSFREFSKKALDRASTLIKKKPAAANRNLVGRYFELERASKAFDYERTTLSQEQSVRLETAVALVRRMGFDVTRYEIVPTVTLGENTLALAHNGKMYLTRECIDRCPERALIEEFMHLLHGCNDETRRMQNLLFDEILRLGNNGIAAGMDLTPPVGEPQATEPPLAPTGDLDDDIPF